MKCCEVELNCPFCNKTDEYVHLDFKNGQSQGFGCIRCETAEIIDKKYVRKEK